MRKPFQNLIVDCAIAALVVAATVAGAQGFHQLSGITPSASLFSCAVMLVAWSRGIVSAILATALTILAFDYFFLEPRYTLAFQRNDLPPLVFFAVGALLVSLMCESERRSKRALREVKSEARANEARFAEIQRELQLTIDTIPAMISTYHPDGTHSFVNKVWTDYTGMELADVVAAKGAGLFHSDDPERVAWRASLQNGEPLIAEAPIRAADGSYQWFSIRRTPWRDSEGRIVKWYSIGFNIEDRKQAEGALKRSQAYLAEAQKLSSTGSFAWDIDSDTHFWSDEMYQIMQLAASSALSTDLILQRVHPEDRMRLVGELNRAKEGVEDWDYEIRLQMPDDSLKYLHIVGRRVAYETGRSEVIGALMDITEARKSQEALYTAQSALAHATRVATLGEISVTIAHEVNQPLGAIVANGQACLRFLDRETPDLESVRGAVQWIVKDGNRAADVIRRVRGMMKKADADKVPIQLNDVIEEVAALLQRQLHSKLVLLRYDLHELPQVLADPTQLQQVIINLMINSAEAMEHVQDRARILVIRSFRKETGHAVVVVEDSGAGIPRDPEQLFDAFFTTKASGLGMGLPICRSIVEDHGGRMWGIPNPDRPGATFQFELPPLEAAAPLAGRET